jgi:hypothetical protein
MFEQSKSTFGLVKITPYHEVHIYTKPKIFVEDGISAYEYWKIRVQKCSALSHLVGDVSTGVFRPTVLKNFQQDIFFICSIFDTQSSSPPAALFHLGMFGAACSGCGSSHPSPSAALPTSTLIWWDPDNVLIIVLYFHNH